MEYAGTKNWERSQSAVRGGGQSGLSWRLGGGSRKEVPEKSEANTPAKPEGRALSRSEKGGQLGPS